MRWVALTVALSAGTIFCSTLPTNLPVAPDPARELPSETAVPRTLGVTITPTPEVLLTLVDTPLATPAPTLALDLNSPHSVGYLRPLTLQHVTPGRATFYFELSEPVEGRLVYWIEGGSHRQPLGWKDLDPTATRHQITIDDLQAGVSYGASVGLLMGAGEYRPPAFEDAVWDPIRFHAPNDAVLPLRVGVFGDSGYGDEGTYRLAEELASLDPDLVLHTGDIVYRAYENESPQAAYVEKLFKPLSPLLHRLPLYPAMGNHEYDREVRRDDLPYYFWAFPPFPDPDFEDSSLEGLNRWYAFHYGPIQFVILDTQAFFGKEGRAEQTAWLEARLRDPRFRATIPVFHVPPYSSGLHIGEGDAVRGEWGDLLQQWSVPLVLSGHDHNYERLQAGGVTFVVTGGGSERLYFKQLAVPESVVFARRTHFVYLSIDDNAIEGRAIALGGDLLDEFRIEY